MPEAFICDGCRTPIGRYAGSLASIRTDDLAAVTIRALMARNAEVAWDELDDVVLGCANQAGEDNRNVARMAALLAGLPLSAGAVTVNRLCASGLEAVGQAARAIRSGDASLVLAGGVESMTRAPWVMAKPGVPWPRDPAMFDTTIGWRFVNPALRAAHGVDTMPETAENVAAERGVSREDQDAFAVRSQLRVTRAQATGFFEREIVPVSSDVGQVVKDEHPREDTTAEKLARLAPIVRPTGTVTAGNSSGVNDGAAALVVASEAAARRHGLRPRARVMGMVSAGISPRVMGLGPVPAVNRLLAALHLRFDDFDVIELNETFAAQALAVLRELGLPDDAEHVNRNGGAIAPGHPLGMSGTRLALTALSQLEDIGGRRALVTLCVGVGQGLALALERT